MPTLEELLNNLNGAKAPEDEDQEEKLKLANRTTTIDMSHMSTLPELDEEDMDDVGSVSIYQKAYEYSEEQKTRASVPGLISSGSADDALEQAREAVMRQQADTVETALTAEPEGLLRRLAFDTYKGAYFGWEGLKNGTNNLNRATNNLIKLGGKLFGVEVDDVFPYYESNPEGLVPNLGDKIMMGFGQALTEIPQWGVAAATGGLASAPLLTRMGVAAATARTTGSVAGAATLGALSNAHEGKERAALAAAEYALTMGLGSSVRHLPWSQQATIMGSTFAGLAAAQGESVEDVVAAGILGTALPKMDPVGGAVGLSHKIKKSIGYKKAALEMHRALSQPGGGDPKLQAEIISRGEAAFLKEKYPDVWAKYKGTTIGRLKDYTVKSDPRTASQRYSDFLDKELKIKEGSALGIDNKLSMLIDKVDVNKRIPAEQRETLINTIHRNVLNADKAETPGPKKTQEKLASQRIKNAEDAEAQFHRLEEAKTEADKTYFKSFLQRQTENWIDVKADADKKLTNLNSPEALHAKAAMRTAEGTTARSHMFFNDAMSKITGTKKWEKVMTKELRQDIDMVVLARVFRHITQRKGAEEYKVQGGASMLKKYNDLYETYAIRKGEKKFEDINKMADKVFEGMLGQAVRQYKNGLMTAESFVNIKDIDYMPLMSIEGNLISNKALTPKNVQVTDTGVKFLDKGGGIINTNFMENLQTSIVMNEKRIANNLSVTAFNEIAKKDPNNGLVKEWKPKKKPAYTKTGKLKNYDKIQAPEGYEKVSFFREGKQHVTFLDKNFNRSFSASQSEITPNMASFFRLASGSAIVRPLATGYNPFFALKNFPIDIAHAWIASGQYSTPLYKFIPEITSDLKQVAKDAWNKEGVYKEAIEEGIGMNWLTHQGAHDLLGKREAQRNPLQDPNAKWGAFKDVMSKPGEFTEIWTRLAIRERNLKTMTDGNPRTATPEQRLQATYQARNYLDFAQGGSWSKSIDNVVPYFNASSQAVATTFRAAKNDPVAFGAKIAQLAAIDAGLQFSSYMLNPDGYEQIEPSAVTDRMVIMTPYQYNDSKGNTRHLYFEGSIDPITAVFLKPLRWAMRKQLTGKGPNPHEFEIGKGLLDSVRESLPYVPQGVTGIPLADAVIAGYSNLNAWHDGEIWGGPEVPYSDEVVEPGLNRQPTPALARWMAEGLGLTPLEGTVFASPERVNAMINSLLPNHFLVQGANGVASWLRYNDKDTYSEMQPLIEKLVNTEGFNRFVGLTHPMSVPAETLDDLTKLGNARAYKQNQWLDRNYLSMKNGEISQGEVIRNVKNSDLPANDKIRLMQRYTDKKLLDRIFKDTPSKDLPAQLSRSTWLNIKTLRPEERAEVFFRYYNRQDGKGKADMRRLAAKLQFYDGGGIFRRTLDSLTR